VTLDITIKLLNILRLRSFDAVKIQNLWFVLLFSFFTGMFTKTIEVWLYKSIQGLLPEEFRNEVKERDKYSIENSERVVRLDVEEDVAHQLYLYHNIKSVEQLAVTGFDFVFYTPQLCCGWDKP